MRYYQILNIFNPEYVGCTLSIPVTAFSFVNFEEGEEAKSKLKLVELFRQREHFEFSPD